MVKRCLDFSIAFLVAADLLPPEILSGARRAEQRAVVPVPEAAMHKDGSPPAWKHHIRPPGQAPVMQNEPEAERVKAAPYDHLGLRVLALYAGHHAAARSRIDYITGQAPVSAEAVPVRFLPDRSAMAAYDRLRLSPQELRRCCQTGGKPACLTQG